MGKTEQCKAESAKGNNSRKMPGAAGSRITETVSHYFVRTSLHCIFLLKKKKENKDLNDRYLLITFVHLDNLICPRI